MVYLQPSQTVRRLIAELNKCVSIATALRAWTRDVLPNRTASRSNRI